MKVIQRGSVWWGRWSVNGKRFQMSSGTANEQLAREILSQKYAESFRERALGEKPRKTWAEATKRYLKEHEDLRTFSEYEKQSAWWTAQFKKRNVTHLDEISPDMVKEVRSWWMTVPKERGGGKRSPADINRKIAYLRAVVNAAYREYRWFATGEEPPLYRFESGEVTRLRFLSPDEVVRLADALPAPYGMAARLAVATGLRRRNVLQLRWDQVDEANKSVTILGQYMKNGELLRIPLNAEALAILKQQRNDSEYVFLKDSGARVREIPSKVWKAACKEAELTNLRWHDLRHTWASLMRQQGVPLEVIQELGGWKDSQMVQRYAHLSIDHLRDAAAAVDKAFGTHLVQRPTTRPHLVVVNG